VYGFFGGLVNVEEEAEAVKRGVGAAKAKAAAGNGSGCVEKEEDVAAANATELNAGIVTTSFKVARDWP
jgi:hypothetical protein